jgi:uncharacterized cupin superfamily protein
MNLKDHIINSAEIAKEYFDQKSMIGGRSSNFSEHFSLKRIGAHHMIIPPGFRTSRPHAESLEEEIVYVIKGEIDLWLNGHIKKLKKGEVIGFPPGTGVGHSFINNSKGDTHLFVAGERTKPDNRYHFHLESDFKERCGKKWWNDMPAQVLGPHSGLPGAYPTSFIDESIVTLEGFSLIGDASFSYPDDQETFSYGACLSRPFGLKSIALWLEKLPPGKRSSWPHAHSHEEEFAYILEGEASIWLDGTIIQASKETALDFKAGSGVAHTIMNQTNNDVFYLCLGECTPVHDQIFYPLHPKRNEEMKEKGLFWDRSSKT